MASYAWATDIHLDVIRDNQHLIRFGESLIQTNPDGILLTGDISTARQIIYHLSALERIVQRPTYFVLGNHDYWGGEISVVRKAMHELANASQYLRYMPLVPYVVLSPSTALVGHDGWYDALLGDASRSTFRMNDWRVIKEFHDIGAAKGGFNMPEIISQSQKLAHAGTVHVMNGIKAAARYHKNIIVLTHFPPFAEAHVHEGKQGDQNAMPWYTSKMMGDMLMDASRAYPEVSFTVLAGHTHGQYDGRPAKNMRVHVGGADYGDPRLQHVIDVV